MFEQLHQTVTPFLTFFGDNLYTQAALVIVLSFLVASIFKYVLIVGLKALISRIHVDLDGSFLHLLHTPIYYSLLLMGFSSAASILAPSDLYSHIIFPRYSPFRSLFGLHSSCAQIMCCCAK